VRLIQRHIRGKWIYYLLLTETTGFAAATIGAHESFFEQERKNKIRIPIW